VHVDVAVLGGLAGTTAALALALVALRIALFGPPRALDGSGALDRLRTDVDRADRLDGCHCEPRLGAVC